MLRSISAIMFLAALLPAAAQARVIAECPIADAFSAAFPGAVVDEHEGSWRNIANGESTIRLVETGGEYDLTLTDAGGTVVSARTGGGHLSVTGTDQMHHLVVERNGDISHFLIRNGADGEGSLLWSRAPTNNPVQPANLSTVCYFL